MDFFTSLLNSVPGGIAEGLVWGVLAIAVFITFRILDFPDLTVEGSIALGGAVTASLLMKNCNPFLATLIALICGLLAGAVTGLLNTKLHIPAILSGILTMLILYSINLHIMGKANIGLGQQQTAVTWLQQLLNLSGARANAIASLLLGLFTCALLVSALYWFFGTELGSAIRATGANNNMAKSQAIDTDMMKITALALSNGLVSLCGSLVAQSQGFADVSMGVGAIVIGLAAVILGEILFARKKQLNFAVKMLSVILGSILYRFVIIIALLLGMPSNDMRLATALIVIIALTVPNLIGKRRTKCSN